MTALDLFIELAGVAGVFVGFGALISASSREELKGSQRGQLQTVVSTGLMVIVAAMIPIGLDRYGLGGHRLWFASGLVFLILSWAALVLALRRSEDRKTLITLAKAHPIQSAFFWLLLELPVQVPLLMIVFGLIPMMDAAFYLTALIFNLFQAAFVLTQFVFSQE